MRKALLVLAAGLAIGSTALSQEATWKWDGQLRARWSNSMGYDLNKDDGDSQNMWNQRVKMGATVAKGENLTGYVSVIGHFNWGSQLPDVRSGTADAPAPADEVYVHEAWAWWKATDMFSFKFGRGAHEMADASVVSKSDYMQHPYTFDGVMAMADFNFGTFGLFGVKGMDATAPTTGGDDPEIVYYGLNFKLKNLPDVLSMVDAFYMMINANDPIVAGGLNANRWGLTVAGDVAGFDYRGTYATYGGTMTEGDTTIKASMYDLEAGYTLADMMNLRFFGQYHSDTGDDDLADDESTTYDPFYYDAHKYSGAMDVVGWGNSTYFAIGASLEPMEGLTTGLTYLSFKRTEEDDLTVGGGILPAATEDDAAVGTEIDLWVNKAYEGGFSLGALYGLFTPGASYDDADPASKFEVTATLGF